MSDLLANVKKVHGPYPRKDKRKHVVLVYEDGRKRTVSYPKFLVEFALGRELDPDNETVDHIDDDFTNNAWANLRIVGRSKHIREDQYVVTKKVWVKCAGCGALRAKDPRMLHRNALLGKAGPFCTRRCAGIYVAQVVAGARDPLPPQQAYPTETRAYTKRGKVGGVLVADLVDAAISEEDILRHCSRTRYRPGT